MFWNDPNPYGVTLPYKDIANPMATMGWHNIPRFLPPGYGVTPSFIPPQAFQPQTLTQQPQVSQPFMPQTTQQPLAFQQPFMPQATQQPLAFQQPFMPQATQPPLAFQQPFMPQVQPFGSVFRPEGILPQVLAMNPYFQGYNVMPQPFHPLRPFLF